MTSAVAIINWNSGLMLRACVESLVETTANAEILVIDNASGDASFESVQGFRNRVNFVRNSINRGFAAAVNQAFQATSTAYVLILNPDVRVLPGAVQLLQDFMDANPRAAAVGGYVGDKYLPRKLPTVGSLMLQNLGWSGTLGLREEVERRRSVLSHSSPHPAFGHPLPEGEGSPLQVEQPAAAALLIRRDAYDDAGGFDERFYPAWYEDVDFCQRLKAKGWDIYFAPQARFLHEGGYSAEALGSSRFAEAYYHNQVRYAQKHFGPAGRALVRASIASGMIGRMIGRPRQAAAWGKVFIGVLAGW
jgi:GT2 family glycosyltransferase